MIENNHNKYFSHDVQSRPHSPSFHVRLMPVWKKSIKVITRKGNVVNHNKLYMFLRARSDLLKAIFNKLNRINSEINNFFFFFFLVLFRLMQSAAKSVVCMLCFFTLVNQAGRAGFKHTYNLQLKQWEPLAGAERLRQIKPPIPLWHLALWRQHSVNSKRSSRTVPLLLFGWRVGGVVGALFSFWGAVSYHQQGNYYTEIQTPACLDRGTC